MERRRRGRARGRRGEEAAAGTTARTVTRVPGKRPWQRGVRGQGQAEESGAGRGVQRGVERGAGGTQRTRPPRAPSTVTSAVHWCPDLGCARPPGVPAAGQVLWYRQRTTVAFGGWRGGRGRPGKRQVRHRGARGERTVQGIPLRQVAFWRTQGHGAGGEAGAEHPLQAGLRGWAELPVTALRHQSISRPVGFGALTRK